MILYLKKNAGFFTILILSLIPVMRWATMFPLNYRFLNSDTTMTSVGQIAGLMGMAMFSISMILSARLKILDKYFYGLNNVYSNHHIIGALAFVLLLFHPLFLVVKYARFSLKDAALFFLPSDNNAMNFGIIALFSMIIVMMLTLYASLKYQRWKFFHSFMVIVFIFALLHTYYAASDTSRDNFLRFYILNLAGLGLVCGFWRAYLARHANGRYEYEVCGVSRLGKDIVKISMMPKREVMKYEPGQFIFISFKSANVSGETHPFSISSSPTEKSLEITVKNLGDYTAGLENLKAGETALIEGPFGKFSYKEAESKNQIWIAGGVGITPFMSMVKSLRQGDGYKINLFYSTKDKDEAVFMDELQSIAQENKDLEAVNWRSGESGRITAEVIAELSGDVITKDIFLCGPPTFMDSLKEQFMKLGVSGKKIHFEKFNFI